MTTVGKWLKLVLAALLMGNIWGCSLERSHSGFSCSHVVIHGPGDPIIEFTSVPGIGSSYDLHGRVSHVDSCSFGVAVYIYVPDAGGWWIKPYDYQPLTHVRADGSWTVDITTGGIDETATLIAAFIMPITDPPPLLMGTSALPEGLFDISVANFIADRTTEPPLRLLYFAGYQWWVKSSDTPVGPGPNLFSDSAENVWIDTDGRLHLKITNTGEAYKCAEIVSMDSFGYGTYVFHLESSPDELDPNVVLGMFTWSDDSAYNYREIDIEFSRWGDAMNDNAQFVVQPWDSPGNMARFNVGPEDVPSTHGFDWQNDSIFFASVYGHDFYTSEPGDLLHTWEYVGNDIPVSGDENGRLNLWLMWGDPPTDDREVEVVFGGFEFVRE